MRLMHPEDLEYLAVGAAVLGTGGGGDPYIGKLMAIQAIRKYGPVRLIGVDELADDALVVPSAMMGAPTVMVEKLPSGEEIIHAFEALQGYLGRKIDATVSIEAGGLNSTTPFSVAAQMDIPLVDADGMGRAFPEIQMVICTLHGVSATPMSLADEKGNSALIKTIDNRWTERLARSITVDMGGSAMIALYVMTGKQVKEAMVAGTLSLAETIGRAIHAARAGHQDPIKAVRQLTNGFEVFRGKIADVQRRTVAGFARGEATFEGIGDYAASRLTLQFQNEHLVAIQDGKIVVSVPDLITVLDAETGDPITTEALRYGFRVVVLGMPCTAQWRTPEALAMVGPRYFGYDVDYVPVETRYGRAS
jgi:DUF917 family protein